MKEQMKLSYMRLVREGIKIDYRTFCNELIKTKNRFKVLDEKQGLLEGQKKDNDLENGCHYCGRPQIIEQIYLVDFLVTEMLKEYRKEL